MSALLYAVNEIKNVIPEQVLMEALYADETPETVNLTTLDDKIITKVLRSRVLVDANLIGGVELIVPLANIHPLFFEDYYTVYRIDPTLTLNKSIVSVLGLAVMPLHYGGSGGIAFNNQIQSNSNFGCGFNPLMGVGNRIGDSASPTPTVHNAQLELVGPNTVLVHMHFRLLSQLGLRCMVENEDNMNNLQPRAWGTFSQLCIHATKAYIWRKLIGLINSGILQGGQELGVIKTIVDSYESSEEDYQTFKREVWGSVAFMNDTPRYNRLLSSMLSPDI